VNQNRITYFINQYPKVSHTFIRREILALERQGFEIQRIALRGWDADLVDKEDQQERNRTRYVLQQGMFSLLWASVRTMLATPVRFFSAMKLALSMGRNAERPWPYHLIYLAEACRILPWIDTFGAEHLHAHFSTNSTEVVMLANVLGAPGYSFTVHGLVELHYGGLAEKIRRSDFVVAISSFGRGQLYHKLEFEQWHKVKVVHCGLDPSFHDVKPTPPVGAPRLVCVARLSKEKGHFLLIEAVHRLAEKGIDLDLVLAGDGEMRSELENQIRKYGLSGKIRITGWISSDQVREEILAARGLILTSFSEGLPVVIMEAMALHRPVLATYVGGIPELVLPGQNGWLFPVGSVDEMMVAIEDFLTRTPDDLSRMGANAYHRVMDRHSVDIESAKLGKLFQEAIR